MSKKKNVLLVISIVVCILLITIGLTFAYFSANITGNEETTTITVTGGKMDIIYNGGEYIIADNIAPSNEPFAIKTFTVTGNNTTNLEMYYELKLIVEENTFSSDALKYKLSGINNGNNGEITTTGDEFANISISSGSINLGVGNFESPTKGSKVHTYNLELYFPETGENQNENQGKIFNAHIIINSTVKPALILSEAIIASGGGENEIIARGTPDYNITNGTSGIYAAEDDYGTSYYYRGLRDELNNNIIFGGFQWKIIRINGSGSVRLIYNGTEEDFNRKNQVNSTGSDTVIDNIKYNEFDNDAKYLGYMFGGVNGVPSTMRDGVTSEAATYNETSSTIKAALDNWYLLNIEYSGFSLYISDDIFCNDRQLRSEVGGLATGPGYGRTGVTTHYAGNHRLSTNNIPSLKCGKFNDGFSRNTSYLGDIGNGNLEHSVGLLTADEAVMAGLKYQSDNQDNYLNSGHWYWTMTPVGMYTSNDALAYVITSEGNLSNRGIMSPHGVRPVISLSSFAEVSGTGSAIDPYILERSPM